MDLILSGYIQSTQLKQTADDKSVCNMMLSFNQRSDQGNVIRQIELTAWNNTAESAAKTFANGGYAIVEGSYRDDVIDRNDGNQEHHVSILVNRIHPGQEGLGLNQVCLVGTAGLDTDLIFFESGACKASNRLAIRRTSEITDWISVESWGKTAETMKNYVFKGKQIYAKGYLKIEAWADKTIGGERSRPVVVIEKLTLLSNKVKGQDEEIVLSKPKSEAASNSSPIPF